MIASPFPNHGIEIADIFRKFSGDYRRKHKLSSCQLKAVKAIIQCRTRILGGHVEECDHDGCTYTRNSYNSCRNRHCPKCGCFAKEKWLKKRKGELLPVAYFHIVFTLPDILNPIIYYNSVSIYNLLFKTVKDTLQKLARSKKHLGAEIGFITILHTWGQNLSLHPHLHCIVPCGGLDVENSSWIYPKKSKKNKKFFIHVNVLSDLFKKIFLRYLDEDFKNKSLKIEGFEEKGFQGLINQLYKKKWITYCKTPFGGPEHVFEYICRYTHRVAISNNRIQKLENDKVVFQWRDYRNGNQIKTMSLETDEFIRRFLLHILPTGFCKIRYFGFWANRNKTDHLKLCKKILGNGKTSEITNTNISFSEWYREVTGTDVNVCPKCKIGRLIITRELPPIREGPA